MQNNKQIAVIGAGISGLSAAAYLANAGFQVDIYEKHASPGGRARQFSAAGYTFDMGPSWYWMPDVFERFFQDFGSRVSDWYRLRLLDPAFEMVFSEGETLHIPDDFSGLCRLFESREPGSAARLADFMRLAQFKYERAMADVVYKPGLHFTELLDPKLVSAVLRFQLFSSIRRQVRRNFRHPHLVALMEFPILFLGAMPASTPALYTLMNYAGLKLGTWYPEGGFGAVAKGIAGQAERNGARIFYNTEIRRIVTRGNRVTGIEAGGKVIPYDGVVAAGDYSNMEASLLPAEFRNYGKEYWQRKTFAPSCLLFYLGLRKTFPSLGHHTLFFEEDLDAHALDIYKTPVWPSKPLFYVCRTTASDKTVAPVGHDNLFLLMPVATGLSDSSLTREAYFELMANRIMRRLGEDIRPYIDYKRSYSITDFIEDYGAYRGNAYGLANTLLQTAIFKPKIRNRKLPNLVYSGQLTVPGPGVPPALISGKVAANILAGHFKTKIE
ncbi:MAG: phytoene dehydrogenase [Sphingobacteriales bacterium 50-39]|nr:phytoene desaturase [Sphingobacteriales bacterium]OJW61285.1 MAG: phytoene dehydrogenase [Sphingobacteriales bacterium 50-39]